MFSQSLSASKISDDFDARIDQGLQLLYLGNFEDAVDTFNSFIASKPQNPAGYFFRAGAYQVKMTDQESNYGLPQYNASLDTAMRLSQACLRQNPRDAWACFIRGGTYGYMAARDARKGSYISALNNGLSALSDCKRALEIDTTLYDSYLAIGSFHYFRTRAVSILKWLPFIGDAREQGIAEIRLAVGRGRYSRVLARNALVWIFIDAKRYREAADAAKALEDEFPQNPFFHWALPEVHWQSGQWARAAEAYRTLFGLVEAARPANNYNRVIIKQRLAKSLYQLGQYREAAEAADQAINYSLDDALAKRLANERRKALETKNRALKKLKAQK